MKIKPHDLKQYINDLANLYIGSFNVYRDEKLGEIPLAFYAEYLRRDEKYLMTKTIKVWSVENQQYVFISEQEKPISKRDIQQFGQSLLANVHQFVPSKQDHMSTTFLGAVVTNQPISKEVVSEVERFRKVKFIKFGWHGWAEFYIGVVNISEEKTYIHKKGKELLKPFELILLNH
ncbi:MAG: hypothetical protein LPK26_03900 [Bacillaceae bacterium]|nr:hypothetical protein [Bacillaceae bacterium]